MSGNGNDNVANILKILAVSAELAATAKANHHAAVALAEQAGITPEQIRASTSRWTQAADDPLADQPSDATGAAGTGTDTADPSGEPVDI